MTMAMTRSEFESELCIRYTKQLKGVLEILPECCAMSGMRLSAIHAQGLKFPSKFSNYRKKNRWAVKWLLEHCLVLCPLD